MATKARFSRSEIGASNPIFNQIRTMIETAFYGNNVILVTSLKEVCPWSRPKCASCRTHMLTHLKRILLQMTTINSKH